MWLRHLRRSKYRTSAGLAAASPTSTTGVAESGRPTSELSHSILTGGGVIEPNTFGTNEFIDSLDQIGAEAYVSVNVGSGTRKEAAAWQEYMTADYYLSQMKIYSHFVRNFNLAQQDKQQMRKIAVAREAVKRGGSNGPKPL